MISKPRSIHAHFWNSKIKYSEFYISIYHIIDILIYFISHKWGFVSRIHVKTMNPKKFFKMAWNPYSSIQNSILSILVYHSRHLENILSKCLISALYSLAFLFIIFLSFSIHNILKLFYWNNPQFLINLPSQRISKFHL